MNRHISVCMLASLATLVACDPGMAARFQVSPTPALLQDSLRAEGRDILGSLVTKYGLQSTAPNPGCQLGTYSAVDSGGGNRLSLFLCGQAHQGTLEFSVTELFTFDWGPMGKSLQRELRDSLNSRFGPGSVSAR